MTLTTEQLNAFMRLAGELSPENLHCDGEISAAQARRKEKLLRQQWRDLEEKFDVQVTEDDVWSQFIASKRR